MFGDGEFRHKVPNNGGRTVPMVNENIAEISKACETTFPFERLRDRNRRMVLGNPRLVKELTKTAKLMPAVARPIFVRGYRAATDDPEDEPEPGIKELSEVE